jgi:hypothetical protein
MNICTKKFDVDYRYDKTLRRRETDNKKYRLSNDKDFTLLVTESLQSDKNSLLLHAPTGSGKTFFSLNYFSKLDCVTFFLVPTKLLKNQILKEYSQKFNIKDAKLHKKSTEKLKNGVYIAVYDTFKSFEKKFKDISYLIVDESHSLTVDSGYREIMEYVKNISIKKIYITGTPTYENFLISDVAIRVKTNKLINCDLIQYKTQSIYDLIIDNDLIKKQSIYFVNNKKIANELKSYCETEKGYTCEIISKETVTDTSDIVLHSRFTSKPDVIICTIIFANGLNIADDNIKNVYFFFDKYSNITTAPQFFARFRAYSGLNFYLYKEFKENCINASEQTIYLSMKNNEIAKVNTINTIAPISDNFSEKKVYGNVQKNTKKDAYGNIEIDDSAIHNNANQQFSQNLSIDSFIHICTEYYNVNFIDTNIIVEKNKKEAVAKDMTLLIDYIKSINSLEELSKIAIKTFQTTNNEDKTEIDTFISNSISRAKYSIKIDYNQVCSEILKNDYYITNFRNFVLSTFDLLYYCSFKIDFNAIKDILITKDKFTSQAKVNILKMLVSNIFFEKYVNEKKQQQQNAYDIANHLAFTDILNFLKKNKHTTYKHYKENIDSFELKTNLLNNKTAFDFLLNLLNLKEIHKKDTKYINCINSHINRFIDIVQQSKKEESVITDFAKQTENFVRIKEAESRFEKIKHINFYDVQRSFKEAESRFEKIKHINFYDVQRRIKEAESRFEKIKHINFYDVQRRIKEKTKKQAV